MKNIPAVQLSSFIHEILKVFRNHHFSDLEEILNQIANENLVISYPARRDEKSLIPELESALENISGEMEPFADYAASLSNQVQWHEASRGVPEFFEGGYSFSVIIGDSGLVPSQNIRMGLYLQNPNVDYPLHAHEAEEYYLILSGRGSWQVGNLWFDAVPGSVFHHQPSEPHRTITESEPLLGLWMWTGLIEGRYWFSSHEDVNCPFKLE